LINMLATVSGRLTEYGAVARSQAHHLRTEAEQLETSWHEKLHRSKKLA
jgi:hypothetical protein